MTDLAAPARASHGPNGVAVAMPIPDPAASARPATKAAKGKKAPAKAPSKGKKKVTPAPRAAAPAPIAEPPVADATPPAPPAWWTVDDAAGFVEARAGYYLWAGIVTPPGAPLEGIQGIVVERMRLVAQDDQNVAALVLVTTRPTRCLAPETEPRFPTEDHTRVIDAGRRVAVLLSPALVELTNPAFVEPATRAEIKIALVADETGTPYPRVKIGPRVAAAEAARLDDRALRLYAFDHGDLSEAELAAADDVIPDPSLGARPSPMPAIAPMPIAAMPMTSPLAPSPAPMPSLGPSSDMVVVGADPMPAFLRERAPAQPTPDPPSPPINVSNPLHGALVAPPPAPPPAASGGPKYELPVPAWRRSA
jgi:hypothetical protein